MFFNVCTKHLDNISTIYTKPTLAANRRSAVNIITNNSFNNVLASAAQKIVRPRFNRNILTSHLTIVAINPNVMQFFTFIRLTQIVSILFLVALHEYIYSPDDCVFRVLRNVLPRPAPYTQLDRMALLSFRKF